MSSKNKPTTSSTGDVNGKVSQLFFTNLQLLGFDQAAMAHMYSIPFNREMFNLPNKKGYEVVMYFLFSKLNMTMCREQFRDCWPIRDKKTEQQFSRTVNRWLTDISKEEADANLPRIVPSMFLSPGGEKFNRLLFHFSSFVVKQCIRHDKGVKERDILKNPVLTPHTVKLSGAIGKAIQCSTVRHRKRFLDTAQDSVITQKLWREYTSDLVKEYRRLSKNIRELEHQLRDEEQTCIDTSIARGSPSSSHRKSKSGELDLKTQAIKRAQRVQKVREMWKSVEGFTEGQSSEIEVVQTIFQSALNKHKIDGREINIKVPEILLRECEQEIQRRQVENTYEGGKLNLLSLLQLWNLSLHLYIEKLQEVGVPQLELSAINTQVHTHHAHLTSADALRTQLSKEVIPELQKSIDDLQSTVREPVMEDVSPGCQRSLSLKLQLPTPPFSFTPDDRDNQTPDHYSSRITPQKDIQTPDAIGKITDSVRKVSRKTQLFQNTSKHLKSVNIEKPTGSRPQKSHLPTRNPSKPRRKVASGPSNIQHSTPTRTEETKGREASQLSVEPRRRVISGSAKINSSYIDEDNTTRSPKVVQVIPTDKKVTPVKELISGGLSQTPAKTATPRAHELLADKIADAVFGGSPFTDSYSKDSSDTTSRTVTPDFNLDNPIASLDTEAFVSKDKIGRSPVIEDDHSPRYKSPSEDSFTLKNGLDVFTSPHSRDLDQVNTSTVQVSGTNGLESIQGTPDKLLDNYLGQPKLSHRTSPRSSPKSYNHKSMSSSKGRQSPLGSSPTNKGRDLHLRSSPDHSLLSKPSHQSENSPSQRKKVEVHKKSPKRFHQLLDGSDVITQFQLDTEETDKLLSEDFSTLYTSPVSRHGQLEDMFNTATPTLSSRHTASHLYNSGSPSYIDRQPNSCENFDEIFNTATPTLSNSQRNADVLFVRNCVDSPSVLSYKNITPNSTRLKLSDEIDTDIFSISPPELGLTEIDDDLLADLDTLSFKPPNPSTLTSNSTETRKYLIEVSPELQKSPLELFQKSPGVTIREVFSEDSLNSHPVERNETSTLAARISADYGDTLGQGDCLEESFTPLKQALEISSPFRPQPANISRSFNKPAASNPMDNLIAKYKKLREASLNKSVSADRIEQKAVSLSRDHQSDFINQQIDHKNLFTLDVDDINLDDSVNDDVKESHSISVGENNNSILDSFLDEENPFLVPTSPPL